MDDPIVEVVNSYSEVETEVQEPVIVEDTVEPVYTEPALVVSYTESVIEIEGRVAEVDALCREFLLVGSIHDNEDVDAFISSLNVSGINTSDSNVKNFVRNRLVELNDIANAEKEAINCSLILERERSA